MSPKRKVLSGGKSSSRWKKRQSVAEGCNVEEVRVVGKVCGKSRVVDEGRKGSTEEKKIEKVVAEEKKVVQSKKV